jgi:hypothetical protein
LYDRRGAVVADGDDAGLDAARQLARVDREQAVRVPGGGPDALVLEQRLVEQDREVVAERGHPADREAGSGAHLFCGRLAHLGDVQRIGELLRVDPVPAGGHAHDRVAVRDEHDRLGDLRLLAADRHGGVLDRAGGCTEPLHVQLKPELAGALR